MPTHSLKVNLELRAKDHAGGWRFLPPVSRTGKTNSFTPHYALVNNQPKYCPEGVYYLRYSEDKKAKRIKVVDELKGAGKLPVSTDTPSASDILQQALTALNLCQRRLAAKSVGLEIVTLSPAETDQTDIPGVGRSLKKSATEYLAFVEKNREYVTYRAYSVAVTEFVKHCKKPTLESIEEKDILAFGQHLKRERNSKPRTVVNRLRSVRTFLLYYKVPWPVERYHMPRFTKRIPTAYHPAEVLALAQSATLDEAEWVAFMVGTGVREKEASYACWTDFDFRNRAFRVREKPDFPKFKIKDCEERTVPINDELVAMMQARYKRYPDSRLVFPTARGGPEGHMLRWLKTMAFRAGLNCGQCQSKDEYSNRVKSCAQHPVCHKWTLHDFRRTYATMLYAQGTPIDLIQKYLGHADILTTMQYLKASNSQDEKTWKAVNAALPGLLAIAKTKS